MRGLTAWERYILQRLASDPPDYVRDVSNEPREYWNARASLFEAGRLRAIAHPHGELRNITDISAAGREALRLDAIVNMTLV
jgi:hypothetical protein